jgi:hypothetical protein
MVAVVVPVLYACRIQFIMNYPFDFGRPALRATQLLNQWVSGALSRGVNRPGCEADHSPPSSSEVKNGGDTPPTTPYVFMA